MTKLWVFLQQAQPRIMVNQHVSTMCIKVKRNQEKNKTKSEDKIIRYISNLSKQEENYYKPVRVFNFHSNNYIENETNGDRNKTLSTK